MLDDGVRAFLLDRFRLDPDGIHGRSHWDRVLENGRRLAPRTGADLSVVEAFAWLHDVERRTNGRDREHGLRAAALVRELGAERLGLGAAQLEVLAEAIAGHTGGSVAADPTIATCWDADRLDLPRVFCTIDPSQLLTEAARDPAVIGWAERRASDGAWAAALSKLSVER